MGPFPGTFHPGLRLEDKWNQYQLLKAIAPMPETNWSLAGKIRRGRPIHWKKEKGDSEARVGEGGRDLKIITEPSSLWKLNFWIEPYLLQEYVKAKPTDGVYRFARLPSEESLCVCMPISLQARIQSRSIELYLSREPVRTEWEAFRDRIHSIKNHGKQRYGSAKNEPDYLRHNLYEDEVAKATLLIPESLLRRIKEFSIEIERFYDGLDSLACRRPASKNDPLFPLLGIQTNFKNIWMHILFIQSKIL